MLLGYFFMFLPTFVASYSSPFQLIPQGIVTSAKKVMFLPEFVCLSVC